MDTVKNSEESVLQIHNTVTDFTSEGQGEQQTVTCLDESQSEKLVQEASEEQKAHSAEVMKQIYRQFRMVGTKFYFKDQPDKVAFEVKGQRVVSKFSDERVAKAMVALSEARGWKTIKISGDREFCRAVWLEASTRGIKSLGYKPTEQDLSDLEILSEKQSKNHIDKAINEPQASRDTVPEIKKQHTSSDVYQGEILVHGAAPYKHEPKNKDNYFVKLLTEQGEKVIWGIDLKRAMSERNVQKGDRVTLEFKGNKAVTVEQSKYDEQGKFLGKDMIDTHRNEWEFQKIGSQEKTAQSVPDITDTCSPKSTPSINKQKLDTSTRVGRLLDHGKAPYQHDSKNEASYFVTLATEQGEKVIWGIDLERAINNSNAQKGDWVTLEFEGKKSVTVEQSKYDEQGKFLAKETIQAHKNEWKIQKNEQYKVVEAVAEHLINSKIIDPEKRKTLKAAVDSRLSKLAESGKMPTIRMYDKNAPIRSSQQAQGQAVVERNTERTR